jgi:hypothetical protein
VRIKLDENLPVSVGEPLRSAGHDVDSVVDDLAGATDSNVLAEATGHSRLLGTLDRGFADVRMHPPESHAETALRVDPSPPPELMSNSSTRSCPSGGWATLRRCWWRVRHRRATSAGRVSATHGFRTDALGRDGPATQGASR